jgi:MFS family permease
MYGLDTTIAADVQGAVVERFGDVQKIAWMGVGFPLGSVATILPIGMSYGLFDSKWMFITFMIVFEAGSALCGAAPSMNALIAGRVIAGIGGSGIYLGGLNLISALTTIQERAIYIALIGFSWGVGTILGPVVGGLFAVNSPTWRWAFYINLVIAGIFAPVMLFIIPSNQPRPELKFFQKLGQLDWVGVTLVAASYALFVTSLTFAGATWEWSDGRTIAMLVMTAVTIILTTIQQTFSIFTTEYKRIFPIQLLKSRSIILLYFCAAAAATGLFVPVYYIPVYFQFAHGDSALKSAVRLLPYIMFCITFILMNGFLMPKFGYYLPWFMFTGVFLIISGALFTTVTENTAPAKVYGYSILMAVGSGASVQAIYSVAEAKTKESDTAAIIGLMNTAQLGSIVLCLTISGAVFQNLAINYLTRDLSGLGFSQDDIKAAVAGTASVIFATADETTKAIAIHDIVEAIRRVYGLVIAAGVLGLISSLFLRWEKLFGADEKVADEEKNADSASL